MNVSEQLLQTNIRYENIDNRTRKIIESFNHGFMTVSVTTPIGVQLLFPKKEVWALVGNNVFNKALHININEEIEASFD